MMRRLLRNEPLRFFAGAALLAASPLLLPAFQGGEFLAEFVVAMTMTVTVLGGTMATQSVYFIGRRLNARPDKSRETTLPTAQAWQFIAVFPLIVAIAWVCTSIAIDAAVFTWPIARPLIYVAVPGGILGVSTLMGGLFGLGHTFWSRRTLNRSR